MASSHGLRPCTSPDPCGNPVVCWAFVALHRRFVTIVCSWLGRLPPRLHPRRTPPLVWRRSCSGAWVARIGSALVLVAASPGPAHANEASRTPIELVPSAAERKAVRGSWAPEAVRRPGRCASSTGSRRRPSAGPPWPGSASPRETRTVCCHPGFLGRWKGSGDDAEAEKAEQPAAPKTEKTEKTRPEGGTADSGRRRGRGGRAAHRRRSRPGDEVGRRGGKIPRIPHPRSKGPHGDGQPPAPQGPLRAGHQRHPASSRERRATSSM